LEDWLPAHHNEPMEGVHVFAVGGGSMFGEPETAPRFDFDVQFNVHGVTLIVCTNFYSKNVSCVRVDPISRQLKGYIDLGNWTIDAGLYVRIPLFPDIFLARVAGNLKDGVTVGFNVVGIISGSARFYVKNTWELWVHLEVSIFGRFFQGDLLLFTIPH